ncbi:hypothetical protein F4859DRAFT_286157 [Xylaria cf. heliscus]|nr:hypothetical protein F4859DRAFT_286157 [Xylaria cf. heliscus]
MYKILLPVAALAGASLAQNYPDPSACSSSRSAFIAGAPTYAPALEPYLGSALGSGVRTVAVATTTLPPDTLADPEGYVDALCSIAAEIPSSLLPDFQSWGSGLLSYGSKHISEYDDFVTQCVTTGEAAATITSYLNSILTGTGGLCQPTSTPGSTASGTLSTPAATATGTNSTSTSATLVPTAAAARPTGVLFGAAAMGGLIGAVALL